jgi:2-hydroxy-6-oxonona-2,4-dienedioate hydrolase
VRYSSLPKRYTRIKGYNIRYLDYDSESYRTVDYKTLILLLELGASAERWLSVAPNLSNYFRLIIVDIIGFGYTSDFFISFFTGIFRKLES